MDLKWERSRRSNEANTNIDTIAATQTYGVAKLGVSREMGSVHSSSKKRFSKTRDRSVENQVTVPKPKVGNSSPLLQNTQFQNKDKHKRTRSASLTDLRPEDRKRVANLIQELANLGSQKETIEAQLKKERGEFETAIKQLIDDQKHLLYERQSVKLELHQCQQMLSQLQEAMAVRTAATSSAASSQRESQSVAIDHPLPQENKPSISHELDKYITSHNSSLKADQDARSDISSLSSEVALYPRSSSTFISQSKVPNRTVSKSDMDSLIDIKENALLAERQKLIEEQALLKHKLAEQERLLRQTQDELSQKREVHVDKIKQLRAAGEYDRSSQSLAPMVRYTESIVSSQQTSPASAISQDWPTRSRSDHSVGVQVDSPRKEIKINHRVDFAVQADFPISSTHGQQMVANDSAQRTIDQTLERTQTLISSARKIIDQSTASLQQSYHRYTPFKDVSNKSADSTDYTLGPSELDEAERTESEIIEDVFYVKHH